ncbi:MAG: hypothetical protein IJJ45_00360 [Clostridia bacterium]|nr:hypothetical protein [Clostridia bacterium]
MNAIGLDIGTTTLSAVVIDSATGAIREARTISNGTDLPGDIPGGKLQDANAIIGKALALVDELKAAHGPICAIGIDGQMHGIVYIDAAGTAVSPLYTWQDSRGDLPLEGGTYVSRLKELTGYGMSTGFGMTTHYWMTLNGAIPKDAVRMCTIFDYIAMKLTGRTEPLMHTSGAASWGLFDPVNARWMDREIAACGMDLSYLPEVTDACVTVGTTADGIPVSCAIGDNQASFIGSVREPDASVLVNMGTGGQVSMQGFTPVPLQDLEMRPMGDKKFILVGSTLCGGRAYALLEKFIRDIAALSGYEGGPLYEAINRIALENLDIAEPWTADTRFSGTRRQGSLRGGYTGISNSNFDAAHLINATLNGIAGEIMDLYDRILKAEVALPTQLIGSGNGLRRNLALRRVFEKRFGLKMQIPAHTEEAAYGAALFGLAAAGVYESLNAAQALIRYE